MKTLPALAVAIVVGAFGCTQPGETSGTNTNWLRACATASECGDLGCTCGRCTPSCTADADCSAIGGVCSPFEAAVLECQGVASRRLCLPACTSSADCSAGRICYRGVCAEAVAPTDCANYPEALVCEDFEGTLDAYQSVVTQGNAAEAVTVATPSGARALEANVRVAPSTAYVRAAFAPVASGSLSVRSLVQLPAGQTTYDHAPLAFWSDEEPAWALRLVAKDGRLEAWSYTTPLSGSAVLTAGEWHCIETTIDIAEAGRVRIELDGELVVDSTGVDTLPNGGISAFAMGSEWAGANATIRVDRVLVGATPIGCWN